MERMEWRRSLLYAVRPVVLGGLIAFVLCLTVNFQSLAAEPATLESEGELAVSEGAEDPAVEDTGEIFLLKPAEGQTWVIDQAGLLTSEEENLLNEKCRRLYDTYGVLVTIVTVDDFGGGDILEWQKRVFMENPFDVKAKDGVMLAISMSERDWGIQTFGDGQRAFNTYGRERIGKIVVEGLSEGEYYEAFDDFAELSGKFLKAAEKGKPYSSEHPYRASAPIWLIIGISFGLSLAVSLIIVTGWKKSMNTQVRKNEAGQYLKQGSFHLTRSSDVFLYHTVSRSQRPKQDSSSSSGGSGMHSTSSGTSGKF